jgi:type VI secretion system secreted protein VgrG
MSTHDGTRAQHSQELHIEGGDAYDVREYVIHEGVNTLFSIDLVVRCHNDAVDLEATVGAEARFRLAVDPTHLPHLEPLQWTGVVSDIEHVVSEGDGLSTYHLRLAPRFWLLTQRTNCRVFQQMTDLEVVIAMLKEWGLPHDSQCSEKYKPKKYKVQYQETDFAFVSRLLEDSGISYVLEQGEHGTTIVLRDRPETRQPVAAPLEHLNGSLAGPRWATGFRAERSVRQGRSTFADHDPRLPNEPLLAHAQSSHHPLESKLESFAYTPGAFKFGNAGPRDTPTADDHGRVRTDHEEARRIAEHDAAARVARSQHFSFRSNCVEVRAGSVVSVDNHPIAERFKKLLVTRAEIRGSASAPVEILADAVSGEVSFKPDRTTPRPMIAGVESATVVGPASETIHCDEFGRVRVQFHWDRYGKMDEHSSCWIPVSQPWAGEGFGMIHLPRIGHEVLVSFLGGNPEEPVIVGRAFTNLRRPPFALPAAKDESGLRTSSVPETEGYNLLRYVDTAGQELVEGRAEKDMRTRVNHDKSLSVGHDRVMEIGHDDEERIGRTQQETVGKDKLMQVVDNLVSVVGKERLLKTLGNMLSHAKTHTIVADDSTNLAVGSSFIYMDRDTIIIKANKVLVDIH